MRYDKDLIRELRDAAVLHHASQQLPYKLQAILDKYIPHLGEACKERGCIDYDPAPSTKV